MLVQLNVSHPLLAKFCGHTTCPINTIDHLSKCLSYAIAIPLIYQYLYL